MILEERAKKIKMLIMDVDGVLSDGRLYYVPLHDGTISEVKSFNAVDGLGLKMIRMFNIQTAIITGRAALTTRHRAKDLCIKYVYEGFLSKLAPFKEILNKTGLKAEEVAYIGDDLTDLPLFKEVGLACCPNNSCLEVIEACHLVCTKNSGDGAVREVCDMLLKSQGLWPQMLEKARNADWKNAGTDDEEIEVVTAK